MLPYIAHVWPYSTPIPPILTLASAIQALHLVEELRVLGF